MRFLAPSGFLCAALFLCFSRAQAAVDANGTETSGPAPDADKEAELARQLQNPVASLISVRFQNNFDLNFGPNDDGFKYTLNFQPVIPLSSAGPNTESTYDWHNSQWTVPIHLSVSQLIKVAKMPVSVALGFKYYAEAPTNGPDWGVRFTVTPLFPTGKKPAPAPETFGK